MAPFLSNISSTPKSFSTHSSICTSHARCCTPTPTPRSFSKCAVAVPRKTPASRVRLRPSVSCCSSSKDNRHSDDSSSSKDNRCSDSSSKPSSNSSNGDGSSGSSGSDEEEPAGAGNGTYPDAYPANEQECNNRFQRRRVDESLRPICGWDAHGLPKHHTSRRGVSNKVQLSTYGDSIGSNLADLTAFLQSHMQDAIGSIHLLPIFPSTGDGGFAPINYQEVDPRLGTWEDVHALSEQYQLCLEYMVNHISPESPQFQDYLAHGDASPYADMFVKWKDIWPQGAPSADELQKVRTRKPAPPVIAVQLADGSEVPLWCTFSDQQMDINPFSEKGWQFTEDSLRSLCEQGQAKLIRLDAFGYVTKKAGTSCFMQEPEVWDLLARIKGVVQPYGVQLLCEVHEDFNLNIELARHGYWVYDFALPLLMLHALRFKTAEPLRHWLSICPRRQITTLDTHDGMGVDDVAGLAPLCAVPELENCILSHGGNINLKHFYVPGGQFEADADSNSQDTAGHCKRSSDSLHAVAQYLQPDCLQGCYKSMPHQYNETYFSAVGEDPKSYLLARAIQFFTPGVPMVYYVGLLAGANDFELLARGSIRDINRHRFTLQEAQEATDRPVVQALLQLCRFRNSHPAFQGRVFVDDSAPSHQLHVRWYNGTRHLAVLQADLASREFTISHTTYTPAAAAEDCDDGGDGDGAGSSTFSLDASSVFSIDAMDLVSRAAVRRQMAQGMVQPGSSDAAAVATAHGDEMADAAGGASYEDVDSAAIDTSGDNDGDPAGHNEQLLEARKSARSMPPAEVAQVAQVGMAGDSELGQQVAGRHMKAASSNGSSSNGSSNGDGRDGNGSSRKHTGPEIGSEAAAAAAAASIQGSLDASVTDEGPSSSHVAEGSAGVGAGGVGELQLEVLDLSWAWQKAQQPAAQAAEAAAAG